MPDRPFAHLHCHTHYSLLDGFNRIPELVAQTKKLGMASCAITDHGNLYGAIEFYTACRGAGVNPVVGYEAYVAPGDRRDKKPHPSGEKYYHLTLLAKNNTGFKNLIKLSSAAFLEGFYYAPRIDRELLEQHSEGLICLSGCLAGELNQYVLRDRLKEAKALVEWYVRVFGDDFYLEIQNNGLGLQNQCTRVVVDLAEKTGVPLVATADAHYLCAADADAHDVLFCINTGKKRNPHKRQYPEESMPNPYYVRSPADMYALFPDHPDAVARAHEIGAGVDLQLDFKKRHFPVFATPGGKTADEHLRDLCLDGAKERYGDPVRPDVLARLDHELGIIAKMGFSAYFLIVWDFVRFAREKGIPCSARGSGCGAVVSYVLYLSHVCPLEYDLLFERFLDPSRTEPPDIDIDFCQDRRELVIQYVKEKYGHDSVAQIGTFGTLAAKAALKDVGRALDVPLERVNMMCKLVPMKGAIALSLDDALKNPDFDREYRSSRETREWVDIARKLEGMNRNVGTHAAGVVIADGPITDYVPVQRVVRKTDDQEGGGKAGEVVVTTQWEMGVIEKVGMLKMDFLGLRTLSLLDAALALIKKTRGVQLDVQTLPLDDRPTYELLQRGDAKGVFQFESDGIRELLKRLKPDNIRDIIACTALYRPGPLEGGMVDEYIECKHGRKKPTYPHPVMEELLGETYAVMVYQEQVMRVLNRLGGIPLSSAYACIKAISKKKEDIINARKVDFVAGAQRQGLGAEKAEEIFELIVKFGGYGFNKSHSAAYAHVTYHTAFLKQHYPAEFMAALLTSEIDDGNKRDMLVDHIADARRMGIAVLPPDINAGMPDFDVVRGQITFGLTAIKGLGRGAAEEIVRARAAGGRFHDLFDFCERVDQRLVPKAAVERLIKAGAADVFGRRRALMLALDGAFESAAQRHADRKRGQRNFFDLEDAPAEGGKAALGGLPEVEEWPELEKLKFEKEALDFYISSHPLAQFDDQLRRFRTHEAADAAKARHGAELRLGGMIVNLAVKTTKTGKRFALFRVEDFTGQAKCVLWSEEFQRFKELIADDRIHLFEGILEWGDRAEPDFIVKRVMTFDDARAELTRSMVVRLPYADDPSALQKLDWLGTTLTRYKGPCPVYLSVRDPAGRAAQFKLGREFWVNPTAVPLDELEKVLGQGAVVFSR